MHLFFVTGAYRQKWYVLDIVWYAMSNEVQFQQQPTIAKNKCIDQEHINMINHWIWDRMDKKSMNQPLFHPNPSSDTSNGCY